MKSKASIKMVRNLVETEKKRIVGLGKYLHAHPEIGFQEYLAEEAISAFLKDTGYRMERGYGGLKTAFRAVLKGKGRGPMVGILAEYDALAGLGHG